MAPWREHLEIAQGRDGAAIAGLVILALFLVLMFVFTGDTSATVSETIRCNP